MSRLVGLHAYIPPERRARLLDSMLGAQCDSAGWKSQQIAAGNATLGWCGWRVPNVAAANGVIVALDGLIYNRHELGDASRDADLLLSLYLKYGFPGAVTRLNGDFAIALYDSNHDTLWLARDRFGVKPLYYVARPDRLAFASRPRALLALPDVPPEVNRRYVAIFAASHYRYFDNHPDESPFATIAQLPPAHVLCLKDGQVTTQAYWSLEEQPDFTDSPDALTERYRDLLADAVAIRVQALDHPAFTLSGGMDSSSVLASAVRVTGRKQHAFSTVYTDKTYDESEDIRSILEAAVEAWHPINVDAPDIFGTVRRMVAAHDEPVATATWLSHFLLAEQVAAQGFGGLLGGLGGDELNAGEYEYFPYFFADLHRAGDKARLDREIRWWMHYHDHPIWRKGPDVVEAWFGRLIDFERPGHIRPDRHRLDRYADALNPDYFDLRAFEPVMEHPFTSYLKNRTYQDLSRETMPCCLRAEDRQTTLFSLDHALPFLDHRLVKFMYRVPGTLKYQDGVTKQLLRQAMRGVLPEETRTRVKKTGWNAPAHLWFSGAGQAPVLDLIHSLAFRQRGIYNLDEVERLVHEHDAIITSGTMRENHMMFIWQLVNLELWFQDVERL